MYLLITLKNKDVLVKKAESFEICSGEMIRDFRDVENCGVLKNVAIKKDSISYQDGNDTYSSMIIYLPDNVARNQTGYLVCEFLDGAYSSSYVCEHKGNARKLLKEYFNRIPGVNDLLECKKAYHNEDYAYAFCKYHGLRVLQCISMEEIEMISNDCDDFARKIA